MWYVVAFAVLYFAYKIYLSSTPSGFAREIAKTQLATLRKLSSHKTSLVGKVLYVLTLSMRPNCSKKQAASIVLDSESACRLVGFDFNFRAVVVQLVANEYMDRTGQSPLVHMNIFREQVNKVIPEGI